MVLTACLLSWLVCLPQQPAPADPEQTPAGRTHYLGRAIAHTMHWTGAAWLLRETREQEENGALLLRWLAVQPGQVVCDLGCGNGYHALPLADAVRPGGKVFAVDVQPQMLQLLEQRADPRQREQLTCITAAVDDPGLPPTSCDLVLMVDVYHELSHPVRVMGHVRRALRPGGRVVLVEFRAEDPAVPIKPEHTMSKAQIVREMAAHGFALAAQSDALPWQHALAFTAVAEPAPRHAAAQFARACVDAWAGGDSRWVAPFLTEGVELVAPAPAQGALVELRAAGDGALLADVAGAASLRLACDAEGRWQVVAPAPSVGRGLYAMHTAAGGGDLAARVQLVRELGYAGFAADLGDVAAARLACEQRGGDVLSAYAVMSLQADADALARVRSALRALAGGPGMLWLALRDGGAATDADAAAARLLTELLRDADATGVEIALYPHHGFWLAGHDHALRWCEKLDHPRLGLCFNLCHFLRESESCDPAPLLRRCGARLFAVTLNGAACTGQDWATLIQPLGLGDFDLRALLGTLDDLSYRGPFALQGFGITAPTRRHLEQSMAAWLATGGARR